jgi:hypothetical protein
VNQGAAKALRRQARASSNAPNRDRVVNADGSPGKFIPGSFAKALWDAMNHKQRGRWRAKLDPTAAQVRRDMRVVGAWDVTAPEYPRAMHRLEILQARYDRGWRPSYLARIAPEIGVM